jgi:hypothetical protein
MLSSTVDLHAVANAALHEGAVVGSGSAGLDHGYAVAIPGTEEVVPTVSQAALVGVLSGYVCHHRRDLAGPDRVLDAVTEGTHTVIDVAEVYADLPSARSAARALHQCVVLDLATHCTVAVDPAPAAAAPEPVPAPRTPPDASTAGWSARPSGRPRGPRTP